MGVSYLLVPAILVLAVLLNPLFISRTDLPAHLLGHEARYYENFITEDTADKLMELVKSFKTIPTNSQDLKYYETRHEHIGEAVPFVEGTSCPHPLLIPNLNRTLCTFPGRLDVGSHYIRSGGHEGLKERYEALVSRILSFGVYLFDLNKYPVLKQLFEDENFQRASRVVCPTGKPYLDPFQFNFIVNTPGQTVAHHIDGVYFWRATRFQFPQWLLAAMKFSGLWEDDFIGQVQVVAYLHKWTEERNGKFVYWTDNGDSKSINPTPFSANVVDGSKVVHAATVYRAGVSPPLLNPAKKISLDYSGNDQWVIRSDGQNMTTLTTDDLRISIVYRAKCFQDKNEADRYRDLKDGDFLTLDEILATFKADLVKRGALTAGAEISAFDLGLLIVKTYVRYPLPPKSIIPYNYCALPRLFPALKSLLDPIC